MCIFALVDYPVALGCMSHYRNKMWVVNAVSFISNPAIYPYVCLQVIAGSGLDIGFTLISPSGYRLVSDFRKSDGIHT